MTIYSLTGTHTYVLPVYSFMCISLFFQHCLNLLQNKSKKGHKMPGRFSESIHRLTHFGLEH